jgi:hypothetical protein
MEYESWRYDPDLEGVDLDEYDEADGPEDDGAPGIGDDDVFSSRNPYREIPTTSSNTLKPRTVAAAYEPNPNEPKNGKLTVVFRDGTVWIYSQISLGEWQNFHASISKGRDWLNAGAPFSAKPNWQDFNYDKLSPEIQGFVAQQRLLQRRAETKYRYKQGTVTSNVTRTLKNGQKKTYTYTKTVFAPNTKVTNEIQKRRRQAGKNPATANKPKRP